MTTTAQSKLAAENDARGRPPSLVLAVLIFALACAPVFATPVLPTIDFYDHISRYYVLTHLTDPFIGKNYEANWSLLPNIGLDVVATTLFPAFPVLATAKIVALLIFAVQYSGVLAFSRALTGRFEWVIGLLAAPLLYSFIFTWGFANFLLGLGLVFWGAAAWLTLRRRLWVATVVGSAVAVAIFLTHGVAFALYGLLIGGLEIGVFLTSAERRATRFVARMAALSLQAAIPALVFAASATAKASDGITNAGRSIGNLAADGLLFQRLLELAEHRLRTIVQVSEGPSLWFDLMGLILTAAVLFALYRAGRLRIPGQAFPAIMIGALLVIITPPAMFGVGYIADRIPLFLALLTVGSLELRLGPGRVDRACVAVLAALCLVRIGSIVVEWRPYSGDFRDYNEIVATMPANQVVHYLNVTDHFRNPSDRRCEMYGPLLVSLHGHASPLFAIQTAQPLRLTGALHEAVREPSPHKPSRGREAAEMHSTALETLVRQRRYQFVLLCDAKNLARPLPTVAEPIEHRGRFTLMRLR